MSIESIENLREVLASKKSGVIEVRPKVVFEIVENKFKEIPRFTLPIPSSKIGSVTTLEASLLCSLLFLRNPATIFEFGTYLGYTTSTLLANMRPDGKLFSIDLPNNNENNDFKNQIDWKLVKSNDAYNDTYLTEQALQKGEVYLMDMKSDNRLTLIKEDSLLFEPDKWDLKEKVDFIFLDGGHTEKVVTADTMNSVQMMSSNAILIWHDYKSNIHRKVTDIVDQYAINTPVIYIKNTMLAFTLNDFSTIVG
jgi:predicted O-methyltransferase YrrM